jgi:NADH:ubiquinone oxidoreductase subunit 3 (subunit A)
MKEYIPIIVGVLVGVTVGWLCLKLWPKTGKYGVNRNDLVCPECGEVAPKIRKPANKQQLLWGGHTCDKCGTEMDKYGARINS